MSTFVVTFPCFALVGPDRFPLACSASDGNRSVHSLVIGTDLDRARAIHDMALPDQPMRVARFNTQRDLNEFLGVVSGFELQGKRPTHVVFDLIDSQTPHCIAIRELVEV